MPRARRRSAHRLRRNTGPGRPPARFPEPPTDSRHAPTGKFFPHGLAGPWRDHSRVMRQLAPCILPAGTNPGPQGTCPLLFFQLASLPRAHPARNRAQLLAARLPTPFPARVPEAGGAGGGVVDDSARAPALLVKVLPRGWQPRAESCSVAEAAYGLLTEQLLGKKTLKGSL